MESENIDVRKIVVEIEATVAERKARGEYPADLRTAVEQPFDIKATADPPEVLALIQTARPVRGNPLLIFIKKVIRRSVAWYVRPIADDQTRFNDSIARELRGLQRRIDDLERKVGR